MPQKSSYHLDPQGSGPDYSNPNETPCTRCNKIKYPLFPDNLDDPEDPDALHVCEDCLSELEADAGLEAADFEIGGGWGDAINWTHPEQFDEPFGYEARFDCHGWKQNKPKVGDTLKAAMEKSWMIFEFVEVKPCSDPPDMFFAKVKPLKQIPK